MNDNEQFPGTSVLLKLFPWLFSHRIVVLCTEPQPSECKGGSRLGACSFLDSVQEIVVHRESEREICSTLRMWR